MKVQRGSRSITLIFLSPRPRWVGGWPTPRHVTPRPLYPEEKPGIHWIGNGWASGLDWRVRNISPSPEFESRIIQPLVSRCTDRAVPAQRNEINAQNCCRRNLTHYKFRSRWDNNFNFDCVGIPWRSFFFSERNQWRVLENTNLTSRFYKLHEFIEKLSFSRVLPCTHVSCRCRNIYY
jgi:hypothetical protein